MGVTRPGSRSERSPRRRIRPEPSRVEWPTIGFALAVLVLVTAGSGAPVSGARSISVGPPAPDLRTGPAPSALHPAVGQGDRELAPSSPSTSRVVTPREAAPPVLNSTLIGVGSAPRFSVYDPADESVYVANYLSDNVSVIEGTQVVASVNVGTYPSSITVDDRSGWVYVTNLESSNVSVINGTELVGTVVAGAYPGTAVYDPADGYVYVSNEQGYSVTVINGTSSVTTLYLGTTPGQGAFNGATDEVYVPGEDSASVSVIKGTAVVGTLTGFSSPVDAIDAPAAGGVYVINENGGTHGFAALINDTSVVGPHVALGTDSIGGVYDPLDGITYVSNYNGKNVTPVGPPGTAGSIATGSQPFPGTFDSGNGLVYIPNVNSANLTVINGTSVVASVSVGPGPEISAYDAANGYLFVPDAGSDTVSELPTWLPVNFTESGLPPGTTWSVNVSGRYTVSSNTSGLELFLPEGPSNYTARSGDARFSANGGDFVVGPSGASVAVLFLADAFSVDFSEVGLPAGTPWGVRFAGTLNTSVGPTIPFSEINGSYGYSLSGVPGWTTPRFTGTVTIRGGPVNVTVVWGVNRYPVRIDEVGLPDGTVWWVTPTPGVSLFSSNETVLFAEPNGSYDISAGMSNGSYASDGGTFVVDAAAATATVTFSAIVFPILFAEVGLPDGEEWSVSIGSEPYFSNTTTLTLSLSNGTYPYRLSGVSGWSTTSFTGTLVVDGAAVTQGISWRPVTYAIRATEQGLPSGTPWSLSLGSQSENASGPSLDFVRGNGSYPYHVAPVPGFIAAAAAGSVVVAGGNASLAVVFTRSAPGGPGAPTALGLPLVDLLGIGAGAVALALVATALLVRRRRRPPPPRRPAGSRTRSA